MENEKINRFAVDFEQATFQLECITNTINAIHTAMVEGSSPADEWTNALYFAYTSLGSLTKTVRSLSDGEGKGGQR